MHDGWKPVYSISSSRSTAAEKPRCVTDCPSRSTTRTRGSTLLLLLTPEPVQGHAGRHPRVGVQNRLEHGQERHVSCALYERRQLFVEAPFNPENLRLHTGTWIAHVSFGFNQNDLTHLRHILEVFARFVSG